MVVPLLKPSREERKKAERRVRRGRVKAERAAKTAAKKRDGRCRFPLCGCRRAGLRLEASHDRHKGSGGNPAGDRSTRDGLITLCIKRHQTGVISRHAGTLRTRYLTEARNDGPVAWDIDAEKLARILGSEWVRYASSEMLVNVNDAHIVCGGWLEVAMEARIGVLEPLAPWQRLILERLALMDL